MTVFSICNTNSSSPFLICNVSSQPSICNIIFSMPFCYNYFLYMFLNFYCILERDIIDCLNANICQQDGDWLFTKVIPFNTFPHIDAFWRLCSRCCFKNIVTKGEIAQNMQFLLLTQRFPLFIIGQSFNYGDFLCFVKIRSKSSAAELSYGGKG